MTPGQRWLFVAAALLIACAANTAFYLARRRRLAMRRTRTERNRT
ncbi:hypothetical protein ACFVOR_37260 [Streptomyces sp. NPDC057837]